MVKFLVLEFWGIKPAKTKILEIPKKFLKSPKVFYLIPSQQKCCVIIQGHFQSTKVIFVETAGFLCCCFSESSTKLGTIKSSDFIALKTMKNASTALKMTLIAACVITDQIIIDPHSEASAKKVVRGILTINITNHYLYILMIQFSLNW